MKPTSVPPSGTGIEAEAAVALGSYGTTGFIDIPVREEQNALICFTFFRPRTRVPGKKGS